MTVDELIERESEMMGRKVIELLGHTVTFRDDDDTVQTIVYDLEPTLMSNGRVTHQRRWATYVNDQNTYSGIVKVWRS